MVKMKIIDSLFGEQEISDSFKERMCTFQVHKAAGKMQRLSVIFYILYPFVILQKDGKSSNVEVVILTF